MSGRNWIFPILVLSLFITIVNASNTYLYEDFDRITLDDLFPSWHTKTPGAGTMGITDGCLFLNESRTLWPRSSNGGESLLITPDNRLLSCMSMEVRLRCSSDNKLASDVGGGSRAWGFMGKISGHAMIGEIGIGWYQIGFLSISENSDWGSTGFWAIAIAADEVLFIQPIQNVDMREWHSYTVMWKPRNATFLVDGEVKATTSNIPYQEMSGAIWLDNDLVRNGNWVELDVTFGPDSDEFIKVDYVHIYMPDGIDEEIESDMDDLLNRSRELMGKLALEGGDVEHIDQLCRQSHHNYEEDYFEARNLLSTLNKNMEGALTRCSQVTNLFANANNTLSAVPDLHGDHGKFLENWYSLAAESWCVFDASETIKCLNWILNTKTWQEMASMFSEANNSIKILQEQGKDREAVISKGDYIRAENSWMDYYGDFTQKILGKIIARVPEPAIIPILGVIGLLLVRLCRGEDRPDV